MRGGWVEGSESSRIPSLRLSPHARNMTEVGSGGRRNRKCQRRGMGALAFVSRPYSTRIRGDSNA